MEWPRQLRMADTLEHLEVLVFLMGVDHRMQYERLADPPELLREIREFEEYLKAECQRLQIELLAEEFSEEAGSTSKAIRYTVSDIAGQLGILHLFCDPDSQERQRKRVQTWDQREGVWLNHISLANRDRIVFVCGDDHVESFKQKLENLGLQVQVLKREIGKNWMHRTRSTWDY